MNQLESNLLLWAICSIILVEILIIICLCRFCFNRIKAKKFYIKREEYEYLDGSHNAMAGTLQSTILRPPPQSDELAVVGTIRMTNPPINSFRRANENFAFIPERETEDDDDDDLIGQRTSHWIELQPKPISYPAVDYDLPSDDYLSPQSLRSAMIDDPHSHFHFQPLRRPPPPRVDTSTESPGVHYSTIVPKSILKGSSNASPPTRRSRTSSKFDDVSRTSVRINTEPSINSKSRMQFANVSQLNDVEWETSNNLSRHVSRLFIPWNFPTQLEQQALEY